MAARKWPLFCGGHRKLGCVADSNFGFRDYATSVLYDDGKIMLFGGAAIRRRPRKKSSI
jgi:hypothetical protein